MANSTEAHYEQLLAPIYTWMLGDMSAATARARTGLERLGVLDAPSGRALDVGCGPGTQSLVLAKAGFAVTSLDPSPTLLAGLRREAEQHQLQIATFEEGAPLEARHPGPFTLITCMGDTLVSLPSRAVARRLIDETARRLCPGGRLVLSWRDLTTCPQGDARFLPVRSDSKRILTCFLEEVDRDHVRVHDLVHEVSEDGRGFTQRISSYLKLRITAAEVDAWLGEAGLQVVNREVDRGMIVRVARADDQTG